MVDLESVGIAGGILLTEQVIEGRVIVISNWGGAGQ